MSHFFPENIASRRGAEVVCSYICAMILVTGGTGLAGSHLLQELTSRGKKVRALHRKSSKLDFVRHVFQAYAEKPEEQLKLNEWVEGDVLDIFSLEDAMKGVTHVYHNVAVISFNAGDRETMMRVNVNGTANVVNVALENNVKKLCHVSSIAALGRAEEDGITDEQTSWVTSRHNSYYAISKYSGEREVWRGTAEGLDAIVVIPSIILGLSDIGNGSMQLFKTVRSGLPFYTPGTNGFISAKDLAKAQVFLMGSDIVNDKFVISAENLSYREALGMIADGFGKKRPYIKVNHFMAILATLASVPIPLLMPLLVDEILLNKPGITLTTLNQLLPEPWHSPTLYIVTILVMSLILRLISTGFAILQSRCFVLISKDIIFNLRCRLIHALQKVSMKEYETLGSGRVISHLVTDLETLDAFIGSTVSKLLISILV